MLSTTETKQQLQELFHQSADIIYHDFFIGEKRALFAYIDGIVNKAEIDRHIIVPLMECPPETFDVLTISRSISTAITVRAETNIDTLADCMTRGEAILIVDQEAEGFVFPVTKLEGRPVSEPPTSSILKGPREGFVESIKTNVTLLRKRIKTPAFTVKTLSVGKQTSTAVAVAYISGIARKDVVDAIIERIQGINIDGIVDSSYVARYIESRPFSIFKQTGASEKPDVVAGKLLEGRLAIIVDGSPIVLTVPFLIMEDFQSGDDYYRSPIRTSFVRIMRVLALVFALFLPALVVALEQFQFQMLPLKLLVTILSSVEGIPFTPLVEMLIALVLFEILNEASVRMPRYVGMAMSVVGAIVLGETAVNAGILSSIVVLITALSAIGLYAIPDQVDTFSVLRFLFVIIAGFLGLFGLVMAALATTAYLVNLEIYGVPYLAPFSPLVTNDLQDAITKADVKSMFFRPKVLKSPNKRRSQ